MPELSSPRKIHQAAEGDKAELPLCHFTANNTLRGRLGYRKLRFSLHGQSPDVDGVIGVPIVTEVHPARRAERTPKTK